VVSFPESVESTAPQPGHASHAGERSTDRRGAGAPLHFAYEGDDSCQTRIESTTRRRWRIA